MLFYVLFCECVQVIKEYYGRYWLPCTKYELCCFPMFPLCFVAAVDIIELYIVYTREAALLSVASHSMHAHI